MRSQTLAVAVIVIVPLAVALTLYAPWGKSAVETNCSAFGGTAIARSVSVDQYFNARSGLDCGDCFRELAAGQFATIDVQIKEEQSGRIPGSPGYYRFAVSRRTDPNCAWWMQSPHGNSQATYGFSENECVSIVPIDESEVSNFESGASWSTPIRSDSGVRLLVSDHVIIDRASGEAIASQRNFVFVNLISRLFGHSIATWQCETQSIDKFDPIGFRTRVLSNNEASETP